MKLETATLINKNQLFVLEKKKPITHRSPRQKQRENRIIHKHQFSTRFMNRSISINYPILIENREEENSHAEAEKQQ